MKIWRLSNPTDYHFAQAGRRGTWKKNSQGIEQRVQPLIIEWLPDSDVIGDFVWPGFDDEIVVTELVAFALKEKFAGFELGPVEMVQEDRFYKLKHKPKKPRVLLPYHEDPLYDLWITYCVGLDLERSTVDISQNENGKNVYTPLGIERYESKVDLEAGKLQEQRFARDDSKGLFIHKSNLGGRDIFHINEFLGWKFCTDEVKQYIEKENFSNIRFLEVGDVIT